MNSDPWGVSAGPVATENVWGKASVEKPQEDTPMPMNAWGSDTNVASGWGDAVGSNDNGAAWGASNQGQASGSASVEGATVFCGGLSFKATEDKIKQFFSQAGTVNCVRIALNDEGRSKGFCHVEFSTAEEA